MRKRREKPSVRDMVLAMGFTLVTDEADTIEATNDVFRLRHYPGTDRIELAVKADFDRWSNSTDFSFCIPKTEKRWREVFSQATSDALAGRCGLDFAGPHERERYVNRSRR